MTFQSIQSGPMLVSIFKHSISIFALSVIILLGSGIQKVIMNITVHHRIRVKGT